MRGRALFERMVARRPVGIFQRGPDALVHLGHANIHCDKSNVKFVFHGRAQGYTVNLDRPGQSHWHGSDAGQGLALGRSELVTVAPYVHDEKPLSERDRVAAIHSGCRLVRSATTVDPHVTGQGRRATYHAGLQFHESKAHRRFYHTSQIACQFRNTPMESG